MSKLFKTIVLVIMTMAAFAVPVHAEKWSFGVMGDTQWTTADPSGQNPKSVALSFINQTNQQFILAGVKFVIEVGDLTDDGNTPGEMIRALAAQPLYDAGIGFFPMRGNHETYTLTASDYGVADFQMNYPQTRGIDNTFGAVDFSSPTFVSRDLNGMSYSFDYDNARFVIIDNWVTGNRNVAPGNGYNYGYSIAEQQPWITGRLAGREAGTHAFVLTHQPIIAENHQDSPFVGYTDANPDMQNAFFASLQNNGVRYYLCGHDHIHQRSMIASPDGKSSVEEVIAASLSSKFYTHKALTDTNWKGQKVRETSMAQDAFRPGYYIYTVDGPRVTVNYYADSTTNYKSDASYPGTPGSTLNVTPVFHFVKQETFGYSLNGKKFAVASGASLSVVQDTYNTTSMKLAGTNASTAVDLNSRLLTKDINTGWADKSDGFASDILTLWGMEDVGIATTAAPFTLTMSYMPNGGNTYLVRQNADGTWTNLGGTLNADGTISASVSQDGTFAVISEHSWHGGADML